VTQRIAIVQRGRCAVFGELAGLRDFAPFERTEGMAGCDAAFTLFDSESEFAQALRAPHESLPRLIVDFTAVAPSLFARTHRELTSAGIELVGAQSGAGEKPRLYADDALKAHEDALAVLRRVSDEVHFTGACATSKAMATVEHLLFAVSCAASAEAIGLATRAGLDADVMRGLLGKGSGANEVLAGAPSMSAPGNVRAIARGQELARTHEHALPVCAAAKTFHQWWRTVA
jgi:3-hydroxyisobutyrate dehydrogenase-like beta-hydroxyacid dehydrogenase